MPEVHDIILSIDPTNPHLIFDIKQRLDRNRAEMLKRVVWLPPEAKNSSEEFYLVSLLEELLLHNWVNTHKKHRELEEKWGQFSITNYEWACGIISQIHGVLTSIDNLALSG